MKKLLIGLCMAASFPAMAQVVVLACHGLTIQNTRHASHPHLNEANKKDAILFNVVIDTSDRSIIIDDSVVMDRTKFLDLQILNSDYAMFNSDSKNSRWTKIIINRYTGSYKFSNTTRSKSGTTIEITSNGSCNLNSQWQAKF